MSSGSSIPTDELVADTGPLLALARIDALPLLARLFRECRVTESVLEECLAKPDRADALAVRRALDEGVLKRRADPKVRHRLRALDRGESTALEAAIQANGVILLDEKLGREMAKYYSVKLIGTVGVLLLGKQRGHMELVMPKINQLRCSGYYLGDTLIRQVRQLADE